MSRSGWWSPALLVAVLLIPRPARAERERVALAVPDHELVEALAMALAPLDLEVVSVEGVPERDSAAEQNTALQATADTHSAVAVIWIERFGSAYLLSAYAAISREVRSRPLRTGPPYDAATAAAVAFSIKTLLREGAVIEIPGGHAQADEADEAPEEADEPPAEPTNDETESAEATEVAALTEPRLPRSDSDLEVVQEPALAARAWLWLELGAGVRIFAGERAAQLGGAATYWPTAADGRLGVALALAGTAASDVAHNDVDAEFSAVEAALSARLRLSPTRRFAIIPEAGVALRRSRLSGRALDGAGSISSRRTSGVAQGAITLAGFLTGRLAVALVLRAGLHAWPVTYTWRGDSVLEEPRTRTAVGLRVIVAL